MSFHHLLHNTTPEHNKPHLFHIIHVLNGQTRYHSTNQSTSINTQVLCNRCTKTQFYMKYGTMSVGVGIGQARPGFKSPEPSLRLIFEA